MLIENCDWACLFFTLFTQFQNIFLGNMRLRCLYFTFLKRCMSLNNFNFFSLLFSINYSFKANVGSPWFWHWYYLIDFYLSYQILFRSLTKFKVVFEITEVKAGEFIRLLMVGANKKGEKGLFLIKIYLLIQFLSKFSDSHSLFLFFKIQACSSFLSRNIKLQVFFLKIFQSQDI